MGPKKTMKITSVVPREFRTTARRLVLSGHLESILSPLELSSVSVETLIDYTTRVIFFADWASSQRLDWTDAETLDRVLVLFFNELFWMNAGVSDGSKTMAAIKFIYPETSKLGSLHFPRSTRGLKAWNIRRPLFQGQPT